MFDGNGFSGIKLWCEHSANSTEDIWWKGDVHNFSGWIYFNANFQKCSQNLLDILWKRTELAHTYRCVFLVQQLQAKGGEWETCLTLFPVSKEALQFFVKKFNLTRADLGGSSALHSILSLRLEVIPKVDILCSAETCLSFEDLKGEKKKNPGSLIRREPSLFLSTRNQRDPFRVRASGVLTTVHAEGVPDYLTASLHLTWLWSTVCPSWGLSK